MNRKILSNEMKLLSLCSRLEQNPSERLEVKRLLEQSINWQLLLEISLNHEVLPLLFYNLIKLKRAVLPENIAALLNSSYSMTLARNTALWEEFKYLSNSLQESGIRIIPLKGIILAKTIYRDIGLRPMIDIDVLVQNQDLRHAEERILRLGYKKQLHGLPESYWIKYQANLGFFNPEKGILLELHWQYAPRRPHELDISDAWRRVLVQAINRDQIACLTPEDTLLSLCLHIGKNITCLQFIKMKNLCDIRELLFAHGSGLDWDYIARKIVTWRIKGLCSYLDYLSGRYLDAPWPRDKIEALCNQALLRKFVIYAAADLKRRPRPQAMLLMAAMLDTLKDFLSLSLIGILMFYQKNKSRIFHAITR